MSTQDRVRAAGGGRPGRNGQPERGSVTAEYAVGLPAVVVVVLLVLALGAAGAQQLRNQDAASAAARALARGETTATVEQIVDRVAGSTATADPRIDDGWATVTVHHRLPGPLSGIGEGLLGGTAHAPLVPGVEVPGVDATHDPDDGTGERP